PQGAPEEAAAEVGDLVSAMVATCSSYSSRPSAPRAANALSARSSCQESWTALRTRRRSTSSRGPRATVQVASRASNSSGSSPGRTGVAARIPCLSALNRGHAFPDGVHGSVYFCTLHLFASARSEDVGVSGMPVVLFAESMAGVISATKDH